MYLRQLRALAFLWSEFVGAGLAGIWFEGLRVTSLVFTHDVVFSVSLVVTSSLH